MKKEMIAAGFLIIILVGCFINIMVIAKYTDEIILLIEEAGTAAASGNWGNAAKAVEDALGTWKKREVYAYIVLPHDKIDNATNVLYSLLSDIGAQSSGTVSATVEMAAAQFESIASSELVKISNIF